MNDSEVLTKMWLSSVDTEIPGESKKEMQESHSSVTPRSFSYRWMCTIVFPMPSDMVVIKKISFT